MYQLNEIFSEMKLRGMKVPEQCTRIQIPNAREVFNQYCTYVAAQQGHQFTWREDYEPFVDWLTDNHGKGIFAQGVCGVGKTMICNYVIPMIFLNYCRLIVSCYDAKTLSANPKEALTSHIVGIDDLGTEGIFNDYGNKRIPFAELMDSAEKEGKLVIVTTNLDTDDIRRIYGERTVDRLRQCCRRIVVGGESMRG